VQVVGAAARLRDRPPVPADARPRRLRQRADGAAPGRPAGLPDRRRLGAIMKTIVARHHAGRGSVPAYSPSLCRSSRATSCYSCRCAPMPAGGATRPPRPRPCGRRDGRERPHDRRRCARARRRSPDGWRSLRGLCRSIYAGGTSPSPSFCGRAAATAFLEWTRAPRAHHQEPSP
jgi:hypothetical protein